MKIASVQVDLDGVWAIRRCYGIQSAKPSDDDPVYAEGLPRFLELFKDLGVQATFFAVGLDSEVPWKARLLKDAVSAGHEIANHSYTHSLDLASKTGYELESEIDLAQRALNSRVGVHPRGFRAPGYSLSEELLTLLDQKGLIYDASQFPSRWGWLMRWVTRRLSRGGASATQYGGGWNGSTSPAPREVGEMRGLYELPVSVSAKWGLPFHGSVAMTLGWRYFLNCLNSYEQSGLPLQYVWHGVDLTDLDSRALLGSNRGRLFFSTPLGKKVEFVKKSMLEITKRYSVMTALAEVERIREENAGKNR